MSKVTIPIGGTGPAVKLSPAMAELYRTALLFGDVDPIRDGRKTNTIVALIDRGLLRESRRTNGVHLLATSPAQVEDEAYDEDQRRDDERKAHAADPERWMQVIDVDDIERHVRQSRAGYRIEIEPGGHRFWYVRINGDTMTAGGTWEEARRAADRFEAAQARDAAEDEDESRSIAKGKGKGLGQPDGMLSAPDAPAAAWVPAAGDTVLHGRDGNIVTPRPFGRILLTDGLKVKVEWPGGVGWHWAHELEHHPMPSDRLARAEIAESEAHTAAVTAAVDGGAGNAEIAQVYADHDRAADELRAAAFADPPPFPKGTPEYAAYEAELKAELVKFVSGETPYEYPSPYATDPAATQETPGWVAARDFLGDLSRSDALLQADLRAGRADGTALPIVPKGVAQYRVGSRTRSAGHGEPWVRTVTVTITGSDMDVVRLIDELHMSREGNPSITALHNALCDGTSLVAKTWPPQS